MKKRTWALGIGAAAAALVGGALLIPRAASGYVVTPPPVPTGSTFLAVASLSGNDTLVAPFNVNGNVVDVASGVGGGADLTFDGVSSYKVSVPVTLGAS